MTDDVGGGKKDQACCIFKPNPLVLKVDKMMPAAPYTSFPIERTCQTEHACVWGGQVEQLLSYQPTVIKGLWPPSLHMNPQNLQVTIGNHSFQTCNLISHLPEISTPHISGCCEHGIRVGVKNWLLRQFIGGLKVFSCISNSYNNCSFIITQHFVREHTAQCLTIFSRKQLEY